MLPEVHTQFPATGITSQAAINPEFPAAGNTTGCTLTVDATAGAVTAASVGSVFYSTLLATAGSGLPAVTDADAPDTAVPRRSAQIVIIRGNPLILTISFKIRLSDG